MTDPGGFLGLGKVVDWAVGGLTAAVGLVWKLLDGRIKKVEEIAEAALPRADFETAREESRNDRQNIRQDVKELFGKADSTKDLINARVDAVREMMQEEIRGLREDMNGGFTRMADAIQKIQLRK